MEEDIAKNNRLYLPQDAEREKEREKEREGKVASSPRKRTNSELSSSTSSSTEELASAIAQENTRLTSSPLPWYRDPDSRRVIVMALLILIQTIAEFAIGITTNSLALLADASHMLSDELSLSVGFIAMQMSKRSRSSRYSYGWERAEIIGALINSIFLLSACLYIVLESVQRFIQIPEVQNPIFILITGSAGLVINVIGLFMFLGHSTHGHSGSHSHSHSHSSTHEPELEQAHTTTSGNKPTPKLNLHGIFLHVMGDALGSLGAMLSGLGIWLIPYHWKFYLDPICSMLIAGIILRTSVPLVRICIRILMQSVPESVNLDAIQDQITQLPGVTNVHEFHIWHLANKKLIGTVHISVVKDVDFHSLAQAIKAILHSYGVHATTIQPEFVNTSQENQQMKCALPCSKEECKENYCCDPQAPQEPGHDSVSPLASVIAKRRAKKEATDLP